MTCMDDNLRILCSLQIDLHTVLEDKLPYWFMKRVDKPFIVIFPNKKCAKVG